MKAKYHNKFNFVRNDLKEFPISANGWPLIALEAWRRGLRVSLGVRGHYTISSSSRSYTFRLSRLAKTKEMALAVRICNDKTETKKHLEQFDVPVPQGMNFKGALDFEAIQACAEEIGFPVCLKANGWSKGKGVFSCINDKREFEQYYNILVNELGCQNLCLEKHVVGEDYRVYVVGDKVVAAVRRVPANVIGNGKSSVQELIDLKNEDKKKNPYLKNCLIHYDHEVENKLKVAGYDLDSVLEANKILYLRDKCNASQGGDSIDVTDDMSSKVKGIAVSAITAIPGLSHGGVDILADDIASERVKATVLEINQAAELGINIYPFKGQPRKVYKDIIDYYFPETAGGNNAGFDNWYFNFREPINLIKNKLAVSVEVPSHPAQSNLCYHDIEISGDFRKVNLKKVVRSRALQLGVHGQARKVGSQLLQFKIAACSNVIEEFVDILKGIEHSEFRQNEVEPFDNVIGFSVSDAVDCPSETFPI